jgi:hypothetical protein
LASEPSGREQIYLTLDERGPALRGEKEAQNAWYHGSRATIAARAAGQRCGGTEYGLMEAAYESGNFAASI